MGMRNLKVTKTFKEGVAVLEIKNFYFEVNCLLRIDKKTLSKQENDRKMIKFLHNSNK